MGKYISAIITFLSGLSISAVAAYYSIIGLIAIFNGSAMAVAVMGGVLEIGKLVASSWLYRNRKNCGFLMKSYLTIAVLVLMLITSMGIFGFLSKAHLEQTGQSVTSNTRIEKLDFNIEQQKTKIERAQDILNQLDKAMDVYLQKEYVTRALRERETQAPEREKLQKEIEEANLKIDKLTEKKFELKQEVNKLEVEVGPLKYIAELVYGEEKAKDMLSEAVRGVIILLIFVFDPLAVLLLIAANISFGLIKNTEKEKQKGNKDSSNESPAQPIVLQKQTPEKKEETIRLVDPLKEILKEEKKEEETFEWTQNPLGWSTHVSSSKPVKTWQDKVISPVEAPKPTKTDVESMLSEAYEEANGLSSVTFNLNSPAGSELKRIIVKHTTKLLKKFY